MRKKGEKGAQIQLSFGMIFSIIIISFTLAIAGYVIWKFVSLSENIECKVFHKEMQEKIDRMWAADSALNEVFFSGTGGNTKKVCFGFINQSALADEDKKVQDEIRNYADMKSNLFFYPRNSCGESSFKYVLSHARTDSFFCVNALNKKVNVKLSIGSYDNSVKISR